MAVSIGFDHHIFTSKTKKKNSLKNDDYSELGFRNTKINSKTFPKNSNRANGTLEPEIEKQQNICSKRLSVYNHQLRATNFHCEPFQ